MESWKRLAQRLKREIYAIYLASKDSRVPWYARVLAVAVVAYAFSPIDLIPDPIPIIGYLDDLLIVPLGIWILLKLIPPPVLAECREQAETEMANGKPTNWVAAGVVFGIWMGLGVLLFLKLGTVIKR